MLVALLAFGNRHFKAPGRGVAIVDAKTGLEADPMLVDRRSGQAIADPAFKLVGRSPTAAAASTLLVPAAATRERSA